MSATMVMPAYASTTADAELAQGERGAMANARREERERHPRSQPVRSRDGVAPSLSLPGPGESAAGPRPDPRRRRSAKASGRSCWSATRIRRSRSRRSRSSASASCESEAATSATRGRVRRARSRVARRTQGALPGAPLRRAAAAAVRRCRRITADPKAARAARSSSRSASRSRRSVPNEYAIERSAVDRILEAQAELMK